MCKLTIVTINYNSGPGLKKTCDSVINQISSNRELYQWILVDGESNDQSSKYSERPLCDIFDNILCESDSGIYNAMNKGLELAVGNYILFMNAGDEFFPGFSLRGFIKFLEYSDKNTVFYTNVFVKYIKRQSHLVTYKHKNVKFNFGLPFCHQAVYVPKSIYSNRRFDESYQIYATLPFFYEIHSSYDFCHVDTTSCIYDMTGLSSTISMRNIKELLRFNREINQLSIRVIVKLSVMLLKSYLKAIVKYQ